MDITCYKCKNTWEVPTGTILSARLKHALGYKEYAFTCPNCGAKNEFTPDEFHSRDLPQNVVPVTGGTSEPGSNDHAHLERKNTARYAPTNPVESPGLKSGQQQAVIRARGVEARRDHSNWAEVMGAFGQGERITIVDTWTDGENTWVQLGPERWINIEQDGEPVLDLVD